MSKRSFFSGGPLSAVCLLSAILLITISAAGAAVNAEEGVRASGFLVKKEKRTTVVSTEYGEISAARATDNTNGSYLLHFFTLDPNSLFLPVVLHADMVFYVHTGSGKLSWTEEDELRTTDLIRGDVYRLEEGSVFFLQSNLETTKTERQKLRIHAIFTDPNNGGLHEPITGPYSSIRDMVLGFDSKVLQAAFNVPAEVIDEILNSTKPPAIIHGVTKTKKSTSSWEVETRFVRALLRGNVYNYNIFETNKKKKKSSVKLFNLFKESKDFENCNGWSTTVTRKKLSALKGSNVGLFMVNLTTGSMMGPHWNPTATEVAVVLQGRGMVRVVCASVSNETECKNRRFEVEEGDVFVVPRFHPMAQMAFNNGTLVFMGFSSSAKRNHPQYLAGQASVFRTLDRDVLALAFDVSNTTLDQLVGPQKESVILGCVSCAEEELRIVEEEREEERERKEEAAKEREKERKREEEEAAKKEEEERQKREEEEEAAKKKKEEEEERKRREEEEERQRREEEEEAAAAKKKKEEEEEARREEEERERREEEEAEAAAKKKEEEERKREEEEAKRKEEEERERREGEEKEAKRREEEERQEREEEQAREREQEQEEEEARERRKREKAREREEEERREDEEERRRHQEEEAKRREEEEQGGGGEQSEGERAAEEERRREEEAQREEQEQREREREEEGGDEWGAASF